MERKNLFKKYQKRLVFEAVIKSLILGFILGFFASIAPAIICIIYNASGLWYCLAVMLGVGALASVIFYLVSFRPSQKQVANRIDRLGLEERAITMMELENSESYMAKLQREDAQERIKATNAKKIRLRIFKIPLIILAVVALLAIGITTFSIFSVEDPIAYHYNPPKGNPIDEGVEYVTVVYKRHPDMDMGGDINDYHTQIVVKGEDAETVVAVPWPGYIFVSWLTENGDIYEGLERTDRKVQSDLLVFAIFLPVSEADPNQQTNTDQVEAVAPINTIIDGNQYYGDHFDMYYDSVKESLINSGSDLSAEQRRVIELYFEALRKQK